MKKLYFVQQEQMLASYKHSHPHFIDSAEFNPRVDCDGAQIASYFLTEEEAKARFDECETEFNEINYKMVEAYIWSYGHITMEDEDYDEFLDEITLGAEPKTDFPSDFDEYEYYEYSGGVYTDYACAIRNKENGVIVECCESYDEAEESIRLIAIDEDCEEEEVLNAFEIVDIKDVDIKSLMN